jgi:hypothetical protein
MFMRKTLLTSSRLCDHPLFSHPLREEGLSKGVVYLVSTRMIEVFPFQIDFGTSQFFRETPGIIERCFSPRIFPEIKGELFLKFLIPSCPKICLFEFNEGGHQCLGGVTAPKDSEMSHFIR